METFTSVSKMSGLAWAADILEGRKPIPTNKSKLEKGEGFQDILDEETKKIKEGQK